MKKKVKKSIAKTHPNKADKANSISPVRKRKEEFLEILAENRGIVSVACKNFGINRTTHYDWLKEDPWYAKRVEEVNESVIDFVESKLFERINGVTIGKLDKEGGLQVYDVPPSDQSISFFLKTRGRSRGYQERQELDHTTKGESIRPTDRPIIITVDGIPKSISDQS